MFEKALQLHQAGQLAAAEQAYRQILAQHPNHVDALYLLSLVLYQSGQSAAAHPLIVKAISLQPATGELHGHLGVVLGALNKTDEAIQAYRQALALKPNYPQALFNLADALCLKEKWIDAIALYHQAAALAPHDAASLANLGRALTETHQYDAAIAAYQNCLALEPSRASAHNNLGNIYKDTGRTKSAIDCYQNAIQADPPNAELASNRLYALHFDLDYNAPALAREHRLWNERYAQPLISTPPAHDNDRDPHRPLRIGYVSPDFRNHVVGWTILPLLQNHDHTHHEIYAYSATTKPDAITNGLRRHFDVWRDISALTDPQAADAIRADRIDILIDLTLHMAGSRLLIFAHKPAPLQATYLGYCSTTGLAAMDYRLSDPHLDPPGSDLTAYTEQTLHLPQSYWCYHPAAAAPPPGDAPLARNGYVTFGCLNNFAKVSPAALTLWADILAALPRSRLLLHCPPGSHRNPLLDLFTHRGVASSRLEFLPQQGWPDYMQTYRRIDLALDPFPYGGGITTCDALWMGVPAITLSGHTAVGRGGRSILANIGLHDLVAATPQEYAHLALDCDRWMQRRPGLRDRMAASPLMDAGRFARDIEAAYRRMWIGWTSPSRPGNQEHGQEP